MKPGPDEWATLIAWCKLDGHPQCRDDDGALVGYCLCSMELAKVADVRVVCHQAIYEPISIRRAP